MFHLALDANEANVSTRVGSNVYAFHIIQELAKLVKKDAAVKATLLLANQPLPDLPPETESWRYRVVQPAKFWTQLALPLYLYQHRTKYDLFFTPGHYAPRFCSIPYISSVMDLAFLRFPDHFKTNDLIQLKKWTRYSVQQAQKVVTISHFSRQEIVNFYQKNKSDILVAQPDAALSSAKNSADKNHDQLLTQFLQQHHIYQPYFLFIGTLQPRKNLVSLIKAYEQFCRRHQETKRDRPLPQLVLAGKIGWLAAPILAARQQSPVKDQIILPGFVDDKIKPALYRQALALVLVGLYEGFGIPALEAMHCQTLPIVSNTSSLPEVVGQAGLLVNPYQIDAISQALTQAWLMAEPELNKYQQEMAKQIKKFSWQQSAAKIYQLLTTTAKEQI